MSTFEFTPQDKLLYRAMYSSRLQTDDLHEEREYIALAAFDGQSTPNDVVSFPVRIENITEVPPLAQNPMATIAFDLILLTPDWESAFQASQKAMLKNGHWDAARPFTALNYRRYVSHGYLVQSLPDGPLFNPHFFQNKDPKSTRW